MTDTFEVVLIVWVVLALVLAAVSGRKDGKHVGGNGANGDDVGGSD